MSSRVWQDRLAEGLARHRAGDVAAARQLYEAAAQQTSDPAPARLLALLLAESGEAAAALDWAQRAVAADMQDAASHAALGRVLMRLGRWPEAAAAYVAMLRRRPEDAASARSCGAALALAGDAEAAAAAAAALPGCGPVRHAWGQILFRAGRWTQAAAVLTETASLLPDDAAVLHDLGTAWLEAGRLDDAEAAYRRALASDATRAPTWHNLGSLRQRRRDMPGAMRCYGRAYTLDPAGFGRIAQELAAGNPGRIWLRPEHLRRDLLASASAPDEV